jgi:anti-anti-sigma factor
MNKYIKTDSLLSCNLYGKIDTLNCVVLEKELAEHMNEHISSVIFNLQEVDYISSTFLRVVIKLVKTLGKENFAITNLQPSIMLVFKIAGLSEVIKMQ